jgi:O-succinylbenzoic acid--CoA ligase
MHELSIFAAAVESPSAECLIDAGRAWTFEEVGARVGAAVASLEALGVGRGARVALTPRAEVDSAVWLYAAFELGCPVVLLHPRWTEREREKVLNDASPAAVIHHAPPVEASGPRAPAVIPQESTLAIVCTSGSRGAPHGVRLSRRAFLASERAHASNLPWVPGDRWWLGMPPAHVGGLSILTRSLIARACVVLDGEGFDPGRTIETIERGEVTLMSVVPTMLHRILVHGGSTWRPPARLRAVLVGGAGFPDALRHRAVQRGVPVLGTYGCTEACSQIATQRLSQSSSSGSGDPLKGIDVRVESGEIQVRGDVLMDGYLGRDRSEEPWTADGWLRTGDFGELAADGQLVVRGRLDDIIVTGGENVAPQEVEAWLVAEPGILEACVFGAPDEEWGELVAAALVTDGGKPDLTPLRDRMADDLASHKRPKAFAVLNALPLNANGKVDRAEVVRLATPKLQRI